MQRHRESRAMESIVLYPLPARGHLMSAVELAKLILTQNPSLIVNIIITNPPINLGPTAPFISAVSTAIPTIKFYHLPTLSVDPNSYPSHRAILFDHYRLVNPHVRQALQSLSRNFTVRCLVIDFFCFPALDIAAELNIPTYYFFTSGASCLALFLHLPTIYENTTQSFKDLDATFVNLPFMPPVPLSHMPESTLVRGGTECLHIINCAAHLKKSAGIIVNTFESLEPKSVKALSSLDRICMPQGRVPPVYCIGPLTITAAEETGDSTAMDCLTWLDSQPSRSVVFVCFGSMGLLSKQQLRELGLGLERSRHKFLWVVRSPPSESQIKDPIAQPEPDLNSLLPDSGFLDRTRDRGLVLKSWAPQVKVLSHDSVGGFVTHCGWNSVLESICAGLPMIGWPLYAEQKINKILLMKELELALPMNESDGGLVSSAEVEERVRTLMDSEICESVRKRVVAKRDEAMPALSQDGSSRVALAKLVESGTRG